MTAEVLNSEDIDPTSMALDSILGAIDDIIIGSTAGRICVSEVESRLLYAFAELVCGEWSYYTARKPPSTLAIKAWVRKMSEFVDIADSVMVS